MMDKISTEETDFKVKNCANKSNSKQYIKHVNDSIKPIFDVSKVKNIAKRVK